MNNLLTFDQFLVKMREDPYKPFGKRSLAYRGEKSNNYALLPKALRTEAFEKLQNLLSDTISGSKESEYNLIRLEFIILKKFYNYCNYNGIKVPNIEIFNIGLDVNPDKNFKDFTRFIEGKNWLPAELIELTSIAQHSGLITRLLDWTYDINVALYFAASGVIEDIHSNKQIDYNGFTIWIIDVNHINIFDNYPIKIITPKYYENKNLTAQKGLFTLEETNCIFENGQNSQINRTPLDKVIIDIESEDCVSYPVISKLEIQIDDCYKVMEYLFSININVSTIFPGYNSNVKLIEEEMMVRNKML